MNLLIRLGLIGAAATPKASLTIGGIELGSVGTPYTLLISASVAAALASGGDAAVEDDDPVAVDEPELLLALELLLLELLPQPATRTVTATRTVNPAARGPPLRCILSLLSIKWSRPPITLSSDREFRGQ